MTSSPIIMDRLTESELTLALLVGASVVKHGFCLWISARNRSSAFEKVGIIKELYVYPVKSLGGIKVRSANCTRTGLEYDGLIDRHWAVSTGDGVYITQRQIPQMALISTSTEGDNIVFKAPDMEALKVTKFPRQEDYSRSKIKIKLEWIESIDMGDKASAWLNKFLNKTDLRLHYNSPSMDKRDAHNVEKLWKHDAKRGDILAFSDYCGYMLMTTASVDDLNTRLTEPVTQLNFRGNIIVDGPIAYEEDEYDEVRINTATFRKIDACTRCIFVNVDPFKGTKSKDDEPLTTLKGYRLKPPHGPKPCLGIHLALDKADTINVGDAVYARRKSAGGMLKRLIG